MKALGIVDKLAQLAQGVDRKFTIDAATNDTETPWGFGKKIHSAEAFDAYCVGCAFHGAFEVESDVTFSVVGGVKAASMDLSGEMKTTVQLGIVAKGPIHTQLLVPVIPRDASEELGLPFFTIPGVLEAGMYW